MYERADQMALHVFRSRLATPTIHLFRLNNGTSEHLCKYPGANLALVSWLTNALLYGARVLDVS